MKVKSIFCLIIFFVIFLFSFVFCQQDSSAEELSKPKYKVKAQFNVPIPMRDGVRLSADVYRPDAKGKFPVLLTRTYYGK